MAVFALVLRSTLSCVIAQLQSNRFVMRTSRTSRAAGYASPVPSNITFGQRRTSRSAPRNRSRNAAETGGIFGVTIGGQAPEVRGNRANATEFSADSDLVEDEAKMLKIEEARRSYLNTCLKQVGECQSGDNVEAFLQEITDLLPDRAYTLEPLIPSLRSRFKGENRSTYASAIQAPGYKSARQQKQWRRSWNEFRKACLGLSKQSEDQTRQNLLGFGFVHGQVDDAADPDETMENAVLRCLEPGSGEGTMGP